MNAKSMRRILVVAGLGLSLSFAARADAQCCGAGYSGYSSYYQPAAYTAYQPVAYSSYYSGWYPGYWLNRASARLWGSPSTYVASYPSSYYASYAPSYSVGYRPAYSVGYSAAYATSYAAPACSSCSTCSSCPSYSAGYSPCSTCATPSCAGCSTCSAPAVSQAVYQQQPGCASCAAQTSVAAPAPQTVAPQGPTPVPQSTYGTQNGAPSLDPGASVPSQRQQDAQRPATNGEQQPVQPAPGSDTNGKDAYDVDSDSSTYFQAPKLFDPNDRTAQRTIAPVTTAVFEKPASYRNVTAQRITLQQAELDAAGWVSTSN